MLKFALQVLEWYFNSDYVLHVLYKRKCKEEKLKKNPVDHTTLLLKLESIIKLNLAKQTLILKKKQRPKNEKLMS